MQMKNKLVARKFPWLFVFLAYGISWLFWIPVALTGKDFRESPILMAVMFLGAFGPGAAGIFLTYREQGKAGGRDFWRRVFDFRRIQPEWYALILLLWPAMHLVAVLINSWMGGSPPEYAIIKANATPLGLASVVILYLLQAALEELGWRGYMLDRLQALLSPLVAALVLGLIHTFWHLPTIWIVGTNQNQMNFLWFLATVVASSVFSSWSYNQNNRSTLSVILLHAGSNLALAIFLMTGPGENIFKILLVMGAIIIAVFWLFQKSKPVQQVTL
jgi:uncharacterized protein